MGLIHRDIKPVDVLLHELYGMMMSYLGLMGALGPDGTYDRDCGTPGFKVPEVAMGRNNGPAADW